MTQPLPQSVLFCCDHNAVRSPMAEGLMKKFYGMDVYVQSVGVKNDLEVDGFSIAVCQEMGVELSRHRSRGKTGPVPRRPRPDRGPLDRAFRPAHTIQHLDQGTTPPDSTSYKEYITNKRSNARAAPLGILAKFFP